MHVDDYPPDLLTRAHESLEAAGIWEPSGYEIEAEAERLSTEEEIDG